MANHINITAMLDAAKPVIEIAPGEIYEVNDDKNVIIEMQAILEKSEANELDDAEMIFNALLGEAAVKEIKTKHPGVMTRVSQIKVLMIGLMAAVNGETFEVVERRFRDET